jgi:hypothetical protein
MTGEEGATVTVRDLITPAPFSPDVMDRLVAT